MNKIIFYNYESILFAESRASGAFQTRCLPNILYASFLHAFVLCCLMIQTDYQPSVKVRNIFLFHFLKTKQNNF